MTYRMAVALVMAGIYCRAASPESQPDLFFMAQRSFYSAREKSLGDAGLAMPGDISSATHNPALLFSTLSFGKGAVAIGYGRDSLFGRHVLPLAFGYVSGKGALGWFYRYQSGDGGIRRNEIALNLSGQIFEQAGSQGAVDFGMNLRYEWMNLDTYRSRSFLEERIALDASGKTVGRVAVDSSTERFRHVSSDRRFILDIGFFQPEILERLDFGLSMRNVIGYEWIKGRPRFVHADSALGDSIAGSDTVTLLSRKYGYREEERSKRRWLAGRYRTLSMGVLYHAAIGEAITLEFPVDLELLGLFDRKMKNRSVFRGGMAAIIRDRVILRLGYARQPKTVAEGINVLKNANYFTGGGGIVISPFSFDAYLSDGEFGMTAGYRY